MYSLVFSFYSPVHYSIDQWNEHGNVNREQHIGQICNEKHQIQEDQVAVIAGNRSKHAVVDRPVQSNQHKTYKESDKFWNEVTECLQQFIVGYVFMYIRNFYFQYEQCNSNGKNRITEKDE